MKKLILLGCAALLLASCAGLGAPQGVTPSAPRKGELSGTLTTDDLKITAPEAFAGLNQVVIGGFTVAFATEKTQPWKTGSGLSGDAHDGKSTAHANLRGVSDTTMQKITDAAYADFVKSLKARGITVAGRTSLLKHPAFAKTTTLKNPHIAAQGGVFGSKDSTRYFAPSAFGNIHPFMGDIAGETGGFGFSNPAMGAISYADKTGRKVLHVVYMVDFANAEIYGGWHTSSSAVKVGQGISIAPEGTKLGLIGGQGDTFGKKSGTIALSQPVNSDQQFATVTDATSGGSRAMETAATVIGALGGVSANAKRSYIFNADAAAYAQGAGNALHKANKKFADQIAKLR